MVVPIAGSLLVGQKEPIIVTSGRQLAKQKRSILRCR
jgi:hypothetical protein